jgi:hypothetical protein
MLYDFQPEEDTVYILDTSAFDEIHIQTILSHPDQFYITSHVSREVNDQIEEFYEKNPKGRFAAQLRGLYSERENLEDLRMKRELVDEYFPDDWFENETHQDLLKGIVYGIVMNQGYEFEITSRQNIGNIISTFKQFELVLAVYGVQLDMPEIISNGIIRINSPEYRCEHVHSYKLSSLDDLGELHLPKIEDTNKELEKVNTEISSKPEEAFGHWNYEEIATFFENRPKNIINTDEMDGLYSLADSLLIKRLIGQVLETCDQPYGEVAADEIMNQHWALIEHHYFPFDDLRDSLQFRIESPEKRQQLSIYFSKINSGKRNLDDFKGNPLTDLSVLFAAHNNGFTEGEKIVVIHDDYDIVDANEILEKFFYYQVLRPKNSKFELANLHHLHN